MKKKNQISNEQNKQISQLKDKFAFSFREEKTAIRNLQRTDNPSGIANFRAALANIRAGREATQTVLNRLNNGEILDMTQITRFIRDTANAAGEKRFAIELPRQQTKTLKAKSEQINTLVSRLAKTGEVVTSKEIETKFDLNKKDADKIATVIRSNAQSLKSEQNKVVNEIFLFIDKGGRFSLEDLNNSGLNQEQINRVVVRQKQKEKELIDILDKPSFRTKTVGELIEEFKDPKTKTFNLLNKKLQSEVFSYNTQREAFDIFKYLTQGPSVNEINEVGKSLKLVSTDLIKTLPETTLKTFGINIKEIERNKLSSTDIFNLSKLNATSLNKLKNLVATSDKKIISFVNSLNRYHNIKQFSDKASSKLLIQSVAKKLFKSINNLKGDSSKKLTKFVLQDFVSDYFNKIKNTANIFKYSLLLTDISDKISKRGHITQSENKEYQNLIKDLLGVRTLTKQSIEKAKKNFGTNTYTGIVLTIKDIQKFVKAVGVRSITIALNDLIFLKDLFFKGLNISQKATYRAYNDLVGETTDAVFITLKRLKTSEIKPIYTKTKKRIIAAKNIIKSVDDARKWAFDNPEIISLTLALMLVAGLKGSRKTLINNPREFFSQAASFFVDDILLTGAVSVIGVTIKQIGKIAKFDNLVKLTKKINKLVGIKFKKNKILKSNKPFRISVFKDKPSKSFRFALKDSDGIVKYFDKKGIKSFRRQLKKSFTAYELNDDLIKQVARFKRKSILQATRDLRLSKQKQSLNIQKQLKELKRTQKATRSLGTTKGFPFFDINTKKIKFFPSRKQWLKAIKNQEKLIRVGKGPKDLIDNLIQFKRKSKKLFKADITITRIPKQLKELKRTQKAVRSLGTTKGFPFFDINTKKIKFFPGRKQWLKAIKRQEKLIRAGDVPKDLIDILFDFKKKNKALFRFEIPKTKKIIKKKKVIEITKKPLKKSIEIKTKKGRMTIDKDGTVKIYGNKDVEKTTRSGQVLVQKQEVLLETKKLSQQKAKLISKPKQQVLVKRQIKTRIKNKVVTRTKEFIDVRAINKIKLATFLNNSLSVLVRTAKVSQLLKPKVITKVIPKVITKVKVKTAIKIVPKVATKIKTVVLPKIKQDIKIATSIKTLTDVKQIQRLFPKQKIITQRTLKDLSEKFKLPKIKLNWEDRLPAGFKRIVNVRIRVRGKNKIIKLETTKNKALKFITSKVDNTTSQSFDLIIVSIAKRKDIKKPSTRKFRMKKSRGTPVLRFVERRKFTIDTRGEKKGLKISRLLRKKRTKHVKKNKRKTKKRRKR